MLIYKKKWQTIDVLVLFIYLCSIIIMLYKKEANMEKTERLKMAGAP